MVPSLRSLRPRFRRTPLRGILPGALLFLGLLVALDGLHGQATPEAAPPVLNLSGASPCLPHQATVTAHPDGGFAVAWIDDDTAWLRRFDDRGAAIGPQVAVADGVTRGTSIQLVAARSGNLGIRVVVANEPRISVRRPDGLPLPDGLSDFLTVTDIFGAPEARIVADPEGGFVIVGRTPGEDRVRLLILDSAGRVAGEPRDLTAPGDSGFGTFQGLATDAVITPDGDLWIAYLMNFVTSPPTAAAVVDRVAAGSSIQERVLERSGSVFLPGNLVARGNEVDLVYLENDQGGSLVIDRFDTDGGFLGRTDDLQLETNLPFTGFLAVELTTAVSDAGGNLLVTWLRTSSENGPSIRALTVSPEGEIVAPPVTLFEDTGERLLQPAAAALEAGRAVVVWSPLLHSSQLPADCTDDPGPFASLPLLRATEPDGSRDLLLQNGRFRVSVAWRTDASGTPESGPGRALPGTDDTGSFWFFDPENLELTVKILDGRTVNGHFWVFYGALSDVAYTVTVEDQIAGVTRTFDNPAGRLASFADVFAFPAP